MIDASGRRTLGLLAVAVLAAHAGLLGAAAERVRPAPPAPTWVFGTRTLPQEAPAAAIPQPPSAETPASTREKPVRRAPGAPLVPPGPAPVADAPSPPALRVAAVPPARSGASSAATPAVFRVAPSMRLRYQVTAQAKGFSLEGVGELDWRHDGDGYEARLEVSSPLLPKRTQQSSGAVTPEGLAPRRFSEKTRHEEAAHFDRDAGKVSFSNNRPDAPLEAGAQDRLSVILQLGAMIAGQPKRYAPGSSITVQTASTRDAEPWVFIVEGREPQQLPGGRLDTLKLTRAPRKEFDVKVELWLAPGMAYAPVRLRLTQPNGDWVDQQWSSTDKG